MERAGWGYPLIRPLLWFSPIRVLSRSLYPAIGAWSEPIDGNLGCDLLESERPGLVSGLSGRNNNCLCIYCTDQWWSYPNNTIIRKSLPTVRVMRVHSHIELRGVLASQLKWISAFCCKQSATRYIASVLLHEKYYILEGSITVLQQLLRMGDIKWWSSSTHAVQCF